MTVKINLKIFLFAILFYFTKQIQIYLMLMIFTFLHEMGHLICGLVLGLKPKSLKIMPLGLCIEFKVMNYDKLNIVSIKRMIIAFAGPLTNILIIFISILIKKYINIQVYSQIIYTNLLIAMFNLLPIYPLDGARILKSLIHIIKGYDKSIKYINTISNTTIIIITTFASIAIYYYKNMAILFIIIYLWTITIIENKRYNLNKRIYKIIQNS